MKKLIILSLFLTGCVESDQVRFDRFMSELECPVILIGKTDKAVAYPSIVVRDGKGRVRTFAHYYSGQSNSHSLPAAIADSRNVGDTLKPCK